MTAVLPPISTLLTDKSNKINPIWYRYFFEEDQRVARATSNLTADIHFYVRTDGNDGNTGRSNDAAGAFLTIQRAIQEIAILRMGYVPAKGLGAFNNFPGGTWTVNIHVGPGTFKGITHTTDAYLDANMYGAGAGTTILVPPGGGEVDCVSLFGAVNLQINGLTLATQGSGGACLSSKTTYGTLLVNVELALTAGDTGIETSVGAGASLTGCSTSGNADSVFYIAPNTRFSSNAFVVNGNPTYSGAFIQVRDCSTAEFTGGITGTATGVRFVVDRNGVINTNGGGANYFPGTIVGTQASGGQYL